MEPDVNTDCWAQQWRPVPLSSERSAEIPKPVRPAPRSRRSGSRRSRSEATRTMLEMLRALAQAESEALPQLGTAVAEPIVSHAPADTREQPPVSADEPAAWDSPNAPAQSAPSGLMLLRSQILGSEPDDKELHCKYCDRVFRLRDGGASFEGNFACSNCEQQLNRDVVLPAVSKHRPHLYQVCEVAAGPEQPKRPAWARQHVLQDDDEREDAADGTDEERTPAENLQEA